MDALDATDLILGGVLMVDDVRHARRSRWLGALLMVALLAGLVVGATALLGGNDGAPQALSLIHI